MPLLLVPIEQDQAGFDQQLQPPWMVAQEPVLVLQVLLLLETDDQEGTPHEWALELELALAAEVAAMPA